MKDKTMRFLAVSFIVLIIFCSVVFACLTLHMNKRSLETINEVGSIYMSGMNERIYSHFETMIDFQLSQIASLEETIQSHSGNEQSLRMKLYYNANARGMEALAFYFSDGSMDMIYGESMTSLNPEPFLKSMCNGENKVSVGMNPRGEKIALIGKPMTIELASRSDCIGLVAQLPIDYISNSLALEKEDSLVYSFVIRRDGSFVIRNSFVEQENYFDRILNLYEAGNGKAPERYIEDLKEAMNNETDYSSEFKMNGESYHLYCSSLPKSEWYLVTIMPYGVLNESVNELSKEWIVVAIGSCIIILLTLGFVFLEYYKMSRSQLHALEEAKLLAEQASRSKGEFLSNMSHDIRTPMNAIVGMTAIAIANLHNTQRVESCLKKIALSSRHLLGLINDVLDMSKIESGRMTLNIELVSLREIVDSLVSIVQPQIKAKNQQFDVLLHDISVENVRCDSVRLNQVLLNLLSNAIKFTPDGGSVLLTMLEQSSPKGSDYIRIQIQVKDSGIGISEEFQTNIFEAFSREDRNRVHKTEGTGLGLAITKYIVDAMDGTITLKSARGEGSEFTVLLDFEKAAESEIDMSLPDWNMLVVDDDRQVCENAAASLFSIGIRAEWTLDGETALKMIAEHEKDQEPYQIILLDWKLPGMDGIETARRIRRQLGDDIPILLISAYDWSEIEESARAAGINGFLSKPLFKSTLFYGLKPYAELADSLPNPEEESAEFVGMRILLAEDNELNWEVAQALLSELGLDLEWAENGRICVEKFESSPVGFYNAILMDIRMPVMTGYEATQAIRALERPDANIPIIAMTADAFSEDAERCIKCGMNAHMSKPIDMKLVSALLRRYLLK